MTETRDSFSIGKSVKGESRNRVLRYSLHFNLHFDAFRENPFSRVGIKSTDWESIPLILEQ